MRAIEAVAHGRNNNFDFIRFAAAAVVIWAHSYPLAGNPMPFGILPGGYDIGRAAVTVFFGISGLLISKSYLQTESVLDFAVARFMRVMPGLIVMLMLTVCIVGPIVTTLPMTTYFQQEQPWDYIAGNIALTNIRYYLPGVFLDNPFKAAVNGSLWTLPFEIRCYVGVLVVGLCGCLQGWKVAIFLILYTAAYIAMRGDWYGPPPAWDELSLPFVVGGGFYVFRNKIPLNGAVLCASMLVTWMCWRSPVARELFVMTLIYGTLLLAAAPVPALRRFGRYGDFSYGLYIYGFLAEQTMAHYWTGITPALLAMTTLAVTLPCAILSWRFVEKPTLERRHALGKYLARTVRAFSGRLRTP